MSLWLEVLPKLVVVLVRFGGWPAGPLELLMRERTSEEAGRKVETRASGGKGAGKGRPAGSLPSTR
jgi:hypothetical protein